MLEDIDSIVPGFAGLYFDASGRLNVNVVDVTKREAVASAIRSVRPDLASKLIGMQVHPARYGFREITDARARLYASGNMTGIVFVDADEAKGALHIGVVDSASLGSVALTVANLGIAKDLIWLSIEPRPRAPSGPYYPSSTIRPVQAGLQISYRSSTYNASFGCTLGYNVLVNGANYFLTNSHCTSTFWGPDGAVFSQPDGVIGSGGYQQVHRIGVEAYDPTPMYNSANSNCPYGKVCRYSDAAVLRYDDTVAVSFATIARTYTTNTGGAYGASPFADTLDVANPWHVVGKQWKSGYSWVEAVGQRAYKMGVSTNLTSGTISRTCVDYQEDAPYTNSIITCQTAVHAETAYGVCLGDSGSPVFAKLSEYGTAGASDVLAVGLVSLELSICSTNYPQYGFGRDWAYTPINGIHLDFQWAGPDMQFYTGDPGLAYLY